MKNCLSKFLVSNRGGIIPISRGLAGLGLLSLLLAIPVSAQPTESFGETLEVHLVNLEVSVEPYLGGHPIMDLAREDFEVYEDGVLRPITHFERVLGGTVESPSESSVPRVEGALTAEVGEVLQYTVLAFDGGSLSHLRLQQAIREVQSFLREQAEPSARWALVLLGSNPRVLLPFTSDHRRVEAALDSLKDLWRGVPVTGWGGAGGFLGVEDVAPEAPLPTETEKREALQWGENLARVAERQLLASLSQLFQGWTSLEGSKSLVMFYEPDLIPRTSTYRELQEVVGWAGAAGFTLYASNAQGLNNPATGFGYSLLDSWVQGVLAVQSGGRNVAMNDLSRTLRIASDLAANHYRISFQVDRAPDGSDHKIEVKVRRPGVFRVRHPRNYLDLAPRERLLRQLRTSSNIPKSVDGRLPLSLEVHVDPVVDELMSITALALVPKEPLGLLTEEDRRVGGVEFFVAIYGESGNVLEIDSEVQPVSTTDRLQGRMVQVFTANLRPGPYTVVMAALDTVDGTVGMTHTLIHP